MTGTRRLLALETSTEACSIALSVDGRVYARHAVAPRQHAELALPWIEALCAEAGIERRALTHIAVGVGPGAFTGVRLAVALAQGLAFARDLPVIPVSTLDIVAAGTEGPEGERICVAMDARMQEVYCATYRREGGRLSPGGAARVCAPEDVVLDGAGWRAVGTGFAAYPDRFTHVPADVRQAADGTALPDARALLTLANARIDAGDILRAEDLAPVYLRNQVADTLAEREARKREAT